MIDDKPDLNVGESIGVHSWGIQPTYGMCADSMGFDAFIMTVSWQEFTNKNMYY
jgi:hypothetical protein